MVRFVIFVYLFFSPKEVSKNKTVAVRSLVTEAYNRWKNAKEQFRRHENLDYHKTAVVFAQNFIDVHEKKVVNVSVQLDKAKRLQIERNRKILASIIKTIIFIGRQEIASRGHRDSGPILQENPTENDGNFRSLLRFRMDSGDDVLKKHLLVSESKIAYTSPKIQNEIIEICGDIILRKNILRINQSGCFTVLADETTDVSGIEQFSLCVRYVHIVDGKAILREDFLKFVPVNDVTGQGLANTLIKTLQDLKVNLNQICGQGYDGASAMSGKFQGCAARVVEQYIQALYVHCANHSLNLAVGDTCEIPIIRNSLSTINEVIKFFRNSAQRQQSLDQAISQIENDVEKKRLKKYCETRWVDRLDAVTTFKELFSSIVAALEEIQVTGNSESAQKAFTFEQSLKRGNFIVAMVVIHEIFSFTHPLTVGLQAKYVDLASAMEMADDLCVLLQNMRDNSETKFKALFNDAKGLITKLGEEINIPRVTNRQCYRANLTCDSPEDY